MASDVLEFQRQTFLTCLDQVKPKLPDSLAAEFEEIKKCMDDADQVTKAVWSHPDALSFLLPLLNDLNDALADCTLFVDHTQNVSQGFSNCNYNPFHQTFSVRKMKHKLKSKKEQLSQKVTQFWNLRSPIIPLFPTHRYTSFDSEPDFQLFGFDEQENKIRDLIFENSYKAIGVYGMAGSGKTSLILKVLNSPTFQNHHFSPIIWLCLSDINSKEDAEYEVNIVKFILCELGCDVDKWTVTNPTKADLLKHLKKLLMSKKYLIVFDDVWENNDFYSYLGDFFPGGSAIVKDQLWEGLPINGGGKVIITSRQKEVVKNMVGEKNLIPMKPLSRETCRMILEDEIGFNEYAKEIEGLLSDSGFVSIGIYGPSSSANTVLVRKVLSNPSVGEMFEHIIWVPVSLIFFNYGQISEFQDSLNVLNEIMKHVLKGLGIYDNLGIYDRDFDLRQIVKESLVSRKYLIVLADVVQDNYNSWGLISSAWPKDGVGTVIVTTKIRELAEGMVGDQNLVHVRLPELGNEGNEVGIDHHYISDAIVDQCGGLPLAVKTLAKIIRQKVPLPDSYPTLVGHSHPLRHPNSYSHPYPHSNPHSYRYLYSDRRTRFG